MMQREVSDAEIDLLCEIIDQEVARGERTRAEIFSWLAVKFEVHERTVKKWWYAETRARRVKDAA